MICVKFKAFCDLRDDLRIRLATLSKFVRKICFCKLALTYVDLRVRLARAYMVSPTSYIRAHLYQVLKTKCFCLILKQYDGNKLVDDLDKLYHGPTIRVWNSIARSV